MALNNVNPTSVTIPTTAKKGRILVSKGSGSAVDWADASSVNGLSDASSIQTVPVSSTQPTSGQILQYHNGYWQPAKAPGLAYQGQNSESGTPTITATYPATTGNLANQPSLTGWSNYLVTVTATFFNNATSGGAGQGVWLGFGAGSGTIVWSLSRGITANNWGLATVSGVVTGLSASASQTLYVYAACYSAPASNTLTCGSSTVTVVGLS